MPDDISIWTAWRHPRQTRDDMVQLQETLGEMQTILEDTQAAWKANCEKMKSKEEECKRLSSALSVREKQLWDSRDANAALASENEDLKERLKKAEQTILDITDQLVRTKHELEENRILEEEVAEFEKSFEKALEMKRDYERRIRDLKMRLRDAKKTIRSLSGEDHENELSIIEMSGQGEPGERRERREKGERGVKTTIPSAKEISSRAEDDWLIDLPETII